MIFTKYHWKVTASNFYQYLPSDARLVYKLGLYLKIRPGFWDLTKMAVTQSFVIFFVVRFLSLQIPLRIVLQISAMQIWCHMQYAGFCGI